MRRVDEEQLPKGLIVSSDVSRSSSGVLNFVVVSDTEPSQDEQEVTVLRQL
jgi:hypothetical protein